MPLLCCHEPKPNPNPRTTFTHNHHHCKYYKQKKATGYQKLNYCYYGPGCSCSSSNNKSGTVTTGTGRTKTIPSSPPLDPSSVRQKHCRSRAPCPVCTVDNCTRMLITIHLSFSDLIGTNSATLDRAVLFFICALATRELLRNNYKDPANDYILSTRIYGRSLRITSSIFDDRRSIDFETGQDEAYD